MTDADLQREVEDIAAGLKQDNVWVSPHRDWRMMRVHTDGAAVILGVTPATLLKARGDPTRRHYKLLYEPGAQVRYRIVHCVCFDREGQQVEDAA